MPARVVDLYVETFIGTEGQWTSFWKSIAGEGASDVRLMVNNVLLMDRAVDAQTVARALETKPVMAGPSWTVA